MKKTKNLVNKTIEKTTVDEFLSRAQLISQKTKIGLPGRLIFSLDATASRQPTWDWASHIQGEMFQETEILGNLNVQLAFYRGFGEFKVSKWINNSYHLSRLMSTVFCGAGRTQIRKVLQNALNETKKNKINALIFIGDNCEEDIDDIGDVAGKLGLFRVPVFIFHEGHDSYAERCFREISSLTGGAYCRFDKSSRETLKNLLCAVAVYSVGGKISLDKFAKDRGGEALLISNQVK